MEKLDDKLNIGQIGVGCALGYLDFRNADRDWREKHKTLSNWFNGFSDGFNSRYSPLSGSSNFGLAPSSLTEKALTYAFIWFFGKPGPPSSEIVLRGTYLRP